MSRLSRKHHQGARLIRVVRVLLAYRIEELIYPEKNPFWLRCLRRVLWVTKQRTDSPLAQRVREALATLGPVYVKFGQALSTRPDLIPEDLAAELSLLQDQVPPFLAIDAVAQLERALGGPWATFFSQFDEIPLASASVAQVHAATLLSGESVAVKIIRPGIHAQISTDVALLGRLAKWVEWLWPTSRQFRPREVVLEFGRHLVNEVDLRRDAANASLLRHNFAESPLLYVPKVYWDLTRRDVMVMEKVTGKRVTDVAGLVAAGVNLSDLAAAGVDIFFTQVFNHNFFHADMHPGNIFIDITNPAAPRYIAMDFGIMGTLPEEEQRVLAAIFQAFFKRDYRRIAKLHRYIGWIDPQVSIDEFAAEIRTVCEPVFDKPLGEISFGMLLVNLFRSARRFDMQMQPDLFLLQKTLLNIEGLGRALYPELDLWATAKPFIERWARDQFMPNQLMRRVFANLPFWLRRLDQLPPPDQDKEE